MSVAIECLEKDSAISGLFIRDLTSVLEQLLEEENLSAGELCVVIADDHLLQSLNRDYRNKDMPTDVLSFNYLDSSDPHSLPGEEFAVGDIYISVEKAYAQAERAGHDIKREIALLAIHGLLHLLGYEHSAGINAEKMREKEQDALNVFDQFAAGD